MEQLELFEAGHTASETRSVDALQQHEFDQIKDEFVEEVKEFTDSSDWQNAKKIAMVGFALIQIEEDIISEDFDELENLLMAVNYETLSKYTMGEEIS